MLCNGQLPKSRSYCICLEALTKIQGHKVLVFLLITWHAITHGASVLMNTPQTLNKYVKVA